MEKISPKYKMTLIKDINDALWREYKTYKDVFYYLNAWCVTYDKFNANFYIYYKDNDNKNIDPIATLHNIEDDSLLLKIAIDLGLETPDYIPSIPTFRNEIKSSYKTASTAFEKAYKCVETDPDTAVGLANSALESILKEILNDARITTTWNSTDTLYKLAKDLLDEFKLYPKSEMPNEIKTIGSSMLSMCQAIEKLRSEKTMFHGKIEEDYILSNPLYVYYIVNSISTIGLFIIKFYEHFYPKQNNDADEMDDGLPF